MDDTPIIISVHELVDFLLRSGDIDNRVFNTETMKLGSKLHSSYQEKQGKSYISEYFLSSSIRTDFCNVILQGRADGIIVGGDYPIIDEIKTTVDDLDHFHETQSEWHLGQAICYAYMYLRETNDEKCRISLTYISQIDSELKMTKKYLFDFATLEDRVLKMLEDYFSIQKEVIDEHILSRDESVKHLSFPYDDFRFGQRELSKYSYSTIKKKAVLFAQAPTGIGKTMATLFSHVKSFENGKVNKIFYLTAKNSGKIAATNAIRHLSKQGLDARDIVITAKEKICFCPGRECNPDSCPFAKDYYTKLRNLITQAVRISNSFTANFIKQFCYENSVCPFEFQLDLSLACDVIIADYNYFLDPITFLERYFSDEVDSSKYVVLIDEAHNLVDRVKSMYSVSIDLNSILRAKDDVTGSRKIKIALGKLAKSLEAMGNDLPFEELSSIDLDFVSNISKVRKAYQDETKDKEIRVGEHYKNLSRELNKFQTLIDQYFNETYTCFLKNEEGNKRITLFCLDPSEFANQRIDKVRSAVLFSATLSPKDYYLEAISGDLSKPFISLPSPFPEENFKLLLAPNVSIKYKDRDKTLPEVASYLSTFVKGKVGNYFIFLPSYEYLSKIRPLLNFKDCDVYFQEKEMTYEDQEDFLLNFKENPGKTTVGVLILGGSFSEGIDLVNDRLIGVAVVGVGLPNVSEEQNLIKKYYDNKGLIGFNYAYKDPGFNKVMQAVGRLIRTPTDIGIALLIDSRYGLNEYKRLVRNTWFKFEYVFSNDELDEQIKTFYNK